ncbi:hypothetical protein [Bradyrhizobium sp. USDA 4473]
MLDMTERAGIPAALSCKGRRSRHAPSTVLEEAAIAGVRLFDADHVVIHK